MENAIEVESLTADRGKRAFAQGLSPSFRSFTRLPGLSGVGKTTLIRCITGMGKVRSGHYIGTVHWRAARR